MRHHRYGAVALALLPFAVAAQDSSAVLRWDHDGQNVGSFRVYYGRSPTALSGAQQVLDPAARTATVDGLVDATWYFAVTAVSPTGAESGQSNVACAVIPSGTCAPLDAPGPVRNLVVTVVQAPSASITVTNVNVYSEFDLVLVGAVDFTLTALSGQRFDYCMRNAADASTITPTTPSIGTNNENVSAPEITIRGPVSTRCDLDAPASFGGFTVRVGGVSKPLVQSGSSWSAAF